MWIPDDPWVAGLGRRMRGFEIILLLGMSPLRSRDPHLGPIVRGRGSLGLCCWARLLVMVPVEE